MSFHFSDPVIYYSRTKDISFSQIFLLENTSGTFYLIVNWIYNHIYDNTTFISLIIKLNNLFVILITYQIITHDNENIYIYDYLLLLHPYMFLSINRNVRDAYIYLFLGLIFLCLGWLNVKSLNKYLFVFATMMLAITRLLCFIPIIFVYLYYHKSRYFKLFAFISIGIFIIVFYKQILFRLGTQFIYNLNDRGEESKEFLILLSGNISVSIILSIIKRCIIGAVVYFFTPHPVNYYNVWVNERDYLGNYVIYTQVDVCLLIIGSIFQYLFIAPLIFYIYRNYKNQNKKMICFVTLFSVIYIFSFLGLTDIRNKYLSIFFMLIGVIQHKSNNIGRTQVKRGIPIYYYLFSLVTFLIILLV